MHHPFYLDESGDLGWSFDRPYGHGDYLSTCLGFELGAKTLLRTHAIESRYCKNLQFTDMLSGEVHAHFEFGRSACFNLLAPRLHLQQPNL